MESSNGSQGSVTPSKRDVVLLHLATLAAAVGAFVIYTGNAYFSERLQQFGLFADVLEISQGAIITNGVTAAIGGIFLAAWHARWEALLGLAAAPVLIATWWLLTRYTTVGARLWAEVEPLAVRGNSLVLRFAIVAFFVMSGTVAGNLGGRYDADTLRAAIASSRGNSYFTDRGLICGLPIGQDRDRSLFLARSGVIIIETSKLTRVSLGTGCPKKAPSNAATQPWKAKHAPGDS